MSFDSSRFTFDPRNNFSGVVMQQGRVQLDSTGMSGLPNLPDVSEPELWMRSAVPSYP